ncbi:Glycoside hydrolase family 57 [Verrucomicrobia bacterium]|nr:Glycoside hydrolase family 57 [Verrucomicrobiota bacterium]
MAEVYHALGLHLHQPLGNLLALHTSGQSWDAKQILWCYDRPTRMLEGYEDVARLHLSFSGTLLKQLEDPGVRQTFADAVDIENFLRRFRQSGIEFVGSGLYHPVYPLTPPADWEAQTGWWQGLARHLLGRDRPPGFWPPEMGFCMEMIPMLKRHGYRYVLVDSIFLKPKRPMRWEEQRYRPYLARYDGAEIIVVPRDRDLSNAQLSGLDPGWFQYEVKERTKHCDFPALVTTWTDGENGGWFRTTHVESGFWGFFYRPLLDRYRAGTLGFAPIHITEFLRRYPPSEEVEVQRGAWNTEHHWGGDFTQWTGSLLQKKGWDEVGRASRYYWEVREAFERSKEGPAKDAAGQLITHAYDHLLTAETSCNFYWGSRWVHKSFDDLEQAYFLLDQAKSKLAE